MDLNKSEIRAELLKAGISVKTIEKAWIDENRIRLLNIPILMNCS